jgi:hypothetical protein
MVDEDETDSFAMAIDGPEELDDAHQVTGQNMWNRLV